MRKQAELATANLLDEYGTDLTLLRENYSVYVDRANELAQTYYAAVRDTWDTYLDLGLPAYDEMQVDADMAAYKQFGGLNNTDTPGYTMSQLSTGNNKAGLTYDDMWAKSVTRFGEQQFINLASSLVNHTARMVIESNADHDPSKPRYARVPSGKYTCAFCVMLASRGWAYKSEESAGGGDHRYHTHCDCTIIPSWGKIKLKNYHPEELQEVYYQAKQRAELLYTADDYAILMSRLPEKQQVYAPSFTKWQRDGIVAEIRKSGNTLVKDAATGIRVQKLPPDKSWAVWIDNGHLRVNPNKMTNDNSLNYGQWAKNRSMLADRLLAEQPENGTIPPIIPLEAPQDWPSDLPKLKADAWNHILYGSYNKKRKKWGGGHLYGYEWVEDQGFPSFDKRWGVQDVQHMLEYGLRNYYNGKGQIVEFSASESKYRIVLDWSQIEIITFYQLKE